MSILEQGVYQHYKGAIYNVTGTAYHTETRELLVIYKALYKIEDDPGTDYFCRPLKMFFELVEVEGKKRKRFEKVR